MPPFPDWLHHCHFIFYTRKEIISEYAAFLHNRYIGDGKIIVFKKYKIALKSYYQNTK